jgi:hypothetical protein
VNETDGAACPDWCRHHRHAGTGEVVAHESRSQIAAAEIDDVPGDVLVSAALRDGPDGPHRGVVLRTGRGLVIDLDAAQAKRLCTLITAAATLP